MQVAFTDAFGYTSAPEEMTVQEMERRNTALDAEGLEEAGHWHPVSAEDWLAYTRQGGEV